MKVRRNCVRTKDGGRTSEVKTTVFPVFNSNPMFCNLRTRSSNRAFFFAALHAKGRISSPKRKSVQNDMLPPKANRPFPNAIHCKTNVGSTHIFVLRRISTPFLNDKDKNGKKGTDFCGSEKYSVPLHCAVGVSFFYIQPRFDEGSAPIFSTSNYNMRFSPNMAIKIRKSPAYRICQFHFPFPDWLDRRCGGKRRWLTLI